MNKLFSKEWWKCAGKRAIRTFGQTAIPIIFAGGAAAIFGNIDWLYVLQISAGAAIMCLLTCLLSMPEYEEEKK